jgi:hypothetical protein
VKSGRADREGGELETSRPPDDALVSWFREGVTFVQSYNGVVALMASAHADHRSAGWWANPRSRLGPTICSTLSRALSSAIARAAMAISLIGL